MTTNFGIKPEKPTGPCCEPDKSEYADPLSYPTVCFRDEHMKLLEKVFGKLDIDQEVEATFVLRVSGVRKDEYGQSTDFKVISMSDGSTSEEPADEPATEDAAPDAPAKAPAKKKPAMPDMAGYSKG